MRVETASQFPRIIYSPFRERDGVSVDAVLETACLQLKSPLEHWIKTYRYVVSNLGTAACPDHIPFENLPVDLNADVFQKVLATWGMGRDGDRQNTEVKINGTPQTATVLKSHNIEIASVNGRVWIPIPDGNVPSNCDFLPELRAALFINFINENKNSLGL